MDGKQKIGDMKEEYMEAIICKLKECSDLSLLDLILKLLIKSAQT